MSLADVHRERRPDSWYLDQTIIPQRLSQNDPAAWPGNAYRRLAAYAYRETAQRLAQ